MAGQQQVASTKGGPDQLVQYVKHNFRKPQQMKVDLDGWLKRQSPATEALAAAVGGSMQVGCCASSRCQAPVGERQYEECPC